jgi:hypothetical protein
MLIFWPKVMTIFAFSTKPSWSCQVLEDPLVLLATEIQQDLRPSRHQGGASPAVVNVGQRCASVGSAASAASDADERLCVGDLHADFVAACGSAMHRDHS